MFRIEEDIFRLMKFSEDLIEKENSKYKRIFVDPKEPYRRIDLETFFKNLLIKLTKIYDSDTERYIISNSKVVTKVFLNQIQAHDKTYTDGSMFSLSEEDLWPVLLRSKCTKPRLANKLVSGNSPCNIKGE